MGARQPAVRVLDHDGDAALRIDAVDEAGCLRGAVRGLASLVGLEPTAPEGMVDDAAAAAPPPPAAGDAPSPTERRARVAGATPVERLVALIDHVIALIDVEGLAAVDADVAVAGDHADARLVLAPVDPAEVVAPPKAATWHGVACGAAGPGRWHARVVIDR